MELGLELYIQWSSRGGRGAPYPIFRKTSMHGGKFFKDACIQAEKIKDAFLGEET